jgi:hypothetical protein
MSNMKLKLVAVCVPTLAACLAFSVALVRPTSVEAGALAKAQAAWQGVGVVHAKFVEPDGRVVSEEWLDRRTGATRRVSYDRLETTVEKQVVVQNGSTIVRWNSYAPAVTYVARVADRQDPWLRSTSQLLGVWRSLRANEARVVGSRQLALADVLRVRVTLSRVADYRQGVDLVADLDRSTYLPVRLTLRAGGEARTLRVVSEQLEETAATKELFVSSRKWTIRDTRIPYEELATRVPFPVYSLGRAYGRFPFRGAGVHESVERTAAFRLQPTLFLGYGRDSAYGQPQLTLTEQDGRTADANARLAAFRAEGKAYRVRIAGATRTVYVLDPDRRPVHFAVVVDRTLVKGNANLTRVDLFAALSKLRLAK